MKLKLLWILPFLTFALYGNDVVEQKRLPLNILLEKVLPLKSLAIKVGTGKHDIYAFIDPFCPKSQNFIEMINDMKVLQKKYTYHLFFYELKRFNSHETIEAIYESKNPLETLQLVMLKKAKPILKNKTTIETQKTMNQISSVAKEINVYKRPYLIVHKKGK